MLVLIKWMGSEITPIDNSHSFIGPLSRIRNFIDTVRISRFTQ